MSDFRVTNLRGRTPGSAPNLPDGASSGGSGIVVVRYALATYPT
jgi:hypothetical protein